MAGEGPVNVAFVGCGNIAEGYAATLAGHAAKVRFVGGYDLLRDRAEALVAQFGGKVYHTLELLLADESVEVVLNLTPQQAHAEVTTRLLEGGKHVHSEKPLALGYPEARKLMALAKRKRRRLSAAPATFLGAAQQTAAKVVREGRLGTLRVVYAEMNQGRVESWHPAPAAFYAVGALFDVGVYPLTVLTHILGPVIRVRGFSKILLPERQDKQGTSFELEKPDWICGILDFEGGILCRLTASFYVGPTQQQGIEFHGDAATLHLSTALQTNGQVRLCRFGADQWQEEPLVRDPGPPWAWGQGVVELAEAIRDDRPHRASAEQAAHVVEVVAGIEKAAATGRIVPIKSRFSRE